MIFLGLDVRLLLRELFDKFKFPLFYFLGWIRCLGFYFFIEFTLNLWELMKLADTLLEKWVTGFMSISYGSFFYSIFYKGLKKDEDVFRTWEDWYIYIFLLGKKALTVYSTMDSLSITSFILGLGAFISETVLGSLLCFSVLLFKEESLNKF